MKMCPHCKSNSTIKHGSYKNIQRFKCKNCTKTFTEKTNTLLSYSKKPTSLWSKYANFMKKGLSLRDCSKKLNISLSTAFIWRHKILKTLENTTILSNYIEGCRINTSFRVNTKKLFIYSLIDSNNNIALVPILSYAPNLSDIRKNIIPLIKPSSILKSYYDRYLQIPFKDSLSDSDSYENFKGIGLKVSNNFRSWLNKFKGISLNNITNYINWFIFDFKKISLLNF